ncbi:MAG: class I SAM-dependent methyltransferase [Acidobacteria bacterium]|nr:class I SAM-dependent methyltransferase [Acidobacteriota bacterium]
MVKLLRAIYRRSHAALFAALRRLGWNVARTADFYSPLPVLPEVAETRELWDRPSELVGVDYDLEAMKSLLAALVETHGGEFDALSPHNEIRALGYGPGFPVIDALTTYLMVRDLRPARYVEIGSGLSTYYAWLAAAANGRDGRACEMTCVDPFPTGRLNELEEPVVNAIVSKVEATDLGLFEALAAGDVLFIDSTHVLKLGGDVAFLFLEVLPRLRPGVVVHVHDIHFPYNTPYPAEQYIFRAKWPLYRTEAMVLQAFLSFNREFEMLLSAPMIRHFDEPFLERTIPGYRPVEVEDYDTHFGSIWLRRRLPAG